MTDSKKDSTLSEIKTSSFERRLSMTKAGLLAGTRLAGKMSMSVFSGKEKRKQIRSDALTEQAEFLVGELGKLKGSVVKIGQMMALYGEHFLPVEVTQALHTLEDKTQALDWAVIRGVLYQELGAEKMAQLEVEPEPIGTASLGQVHRAKVINSGEMICLKVQYPGVAQAIDADLDAVAQLLKITRIVSSGPVFDEWLEEVRTMMHREVDYRLEAQTTDRFCKLVADDKRYIVPKVFFEYCSDHVLATRYEPGFSVSSAEVADLSQPRRNALAKASLSIFLNELYAWHEIQTDPNFGNYRIRIDENGEEDQIVLLDFGAVQAYPASFIDPVCQMINAAYREDLEGLIDGAIALDIMKREWPQSVLDEFGQVCMSILEPLAAELSGDEVSLNEAGEYQWLQSDLPTRVAKRATKSAISRHFKIPPKEFVFLNRKLVGVYTFIAVLKAEFNGRELLAKYIKH